MPGIGAAVCAQAVIPLTRPGWYALPDGSDVPWHRVINARGEVSARSGGRTFEVIQRTLLEAEGVTFDPRGRVDLERFRWEE